MSHRLPLQPRNAPSPTTAALPPPQRLAELGTVLCLYRPQLGGELGGWAQAVRVEARAGVDSDGLRESLLFFDRDGRCCWRLYLLPDSDFLAWDRLLSELPASGEADSAAGVAERLWRRLAGRLGGERWSASPVQLHLVRARGRAPRLAALPTEVSPLGAATARRILQAEGAEGGQRIHDCCCAASAPAPRAAGGAESAPILFRTRAI
ncbi:Hemin transport protein [Pseudoxanthomonas mexicana]|uniref:Hemin transport protein n=1 Tax=Pseudoxanthomonas mexicana TaxID=128785 RepID=UPI00398B6324